MAFQATLGLALPLVWDGETKRRPTPGFNPSRYYQGPRCMGKQWCLCFFSEPIAFLANTGNPWTVASHSFQFGIGPSSLGVTPLGFDGPKEPRVPRYLSEDVETRITTSGRYLGSEGKLHGRFYVLPHALGNSPFLFQWQSQTITRPRGSLGLSSKPWDCYPSG